MLVYTLIVYYKYRKIERKKERKKDRERELHRVYARSGTQKNACGRTLEKSFSLI